MNIQAINSINNFHKSQIKFGRSLSEQLGLDAQVRNSVDSYMPEIKKEIGEFVKTEMRAARSSISNEINAKIDAQDKFNQIKAAVQNAKRAGDRNQLERETDRILSERPVNMNSQISILEQLRSNPIKRKEFINNNI